MNLARLSLAVCVLSASGLACSASAETIYPGYDYMQTLSGTYFNFPGIGNVPLQGRPINPLQSQADTIVQRLGAIDFTTIGTTPYAGNPGDPGTPGTSVTIPTEMVALQLQSVQPVYHLDSFFDVFIDLSPAQPSAGSMTIDHRWDESGQYHGTFSSFFDVWFEVTLHPLDGSPIVPLGTQHINLRSQGTLWRHSGVGLDFIVREEHPGGQGVHMAQTIPLPPAAWAGMTCLVGLAGLQALGRRSTRS